MEKDIEQFLNQLANQLDKWADESQYGGGWSTHQVEPQRKKADEIRRFIWQQEQLKYKFKTPDKVTQ